MPSFLVTGATGRQGSGIIQPLLQKGVQIHALTRDSTSPAAERLKNLGVLVFEGDISDYDAVRRAALGTSGAFLNPPYNGGPIAASDACATFVRAISEVDTVHSLVVSTSLGTGEHPHRAAEDPDYPNATHYSEKSRIETLVRQSGLPNITILRPAWLMHNYLPPFSGILFPELAASHTYVTGLRAETKVPHTDARDIGRWAAAALLDAEKFAGTEINVASENLTAAETASIISRVSGMQVTAPVPDFDKDGNTIGITTRALPFQTFANRFDLTVDVAKLELESHIRPVRLEEFLNEHVSDLKVTFTKP